MVVIMCFTLPAMLALALTCMFLKRVISAREMVLTGSVFALLINTSVFVLLSFPFSYSYISISDPNIFHTNFALKYIFMSCIFAFIYAAVYVTFVRHGNAELKIVPFPHKPQKLWRRILHVGSSLLIVFIGLFLYFAGNQFELLYKDVSLASNIFMLKNPVQGVNPDYLNDFLLACVPKAVLLTIVFWLFTVDWAQSNLDLNLKLFTKNVKLTLFPFRRLRKSLLPFSIIVLLTFSFYSLNKVGLDDLMTYYFQKSTFFDENYVNPNSVELTFPENKKNIINIYLESMESGYSDIGPSGAPKSNLIPNLSKLAEENIHFSNSSTLGGATSIYGTDWTAAALTAHTSGTPMLIAVDGNSLGRHEKYMSGVCSIGDLLKNQGYNQMVMFGSDAAFGGRDKYFSEHGDYVIKDYYTAIEDNIIDKGYKVWWGFEDEKLYSYARQEITTLAAKDQPFNFTMLTVDTHFAEGFRCRLCQDESAFQYSNVISCADRQIMEFVEWLQQQDFYEDTVIVISGDHFSMDRQYFGEMNVEFEDRSIYNVIINSAVDTAKTKNRDFLTMDMYPTVLAAMGVKISGDRLGLGTNLFSKEPTLLEKYGFEHMENELKKRSPYYDKNLL